MANRENRSPIDSRLRVESPEDRERELTRQLIEVARVMINARDGESGLVRAQLAKELEGSDIHFYTLMDLSSHYLRLEEVPFAFRKKDTQAGWLGASLDEDTLLMYAVDPQWHVKGSMLAKVFALDKDEWQYGIERGRGVFEPPAPPVFQDVGKPAVFKRWGQGEDGQANWRLVEKGKMDFGDWFRSGSQRKEINPEYAAKAHAKAEIFAQAERVEEERLRAIYTAREQEEQRPLLQKALDIKQRSDKLWEDRKAEEARLNANPYDELKKQVQERHAQLSEPDQQYLRKELRYRLRDDFSLGTAKDLRKNAEWASKEIGFFKGLTQQGKDLRAYLGDISQILGEESLQQIETQEKQRLANKEAFDRQRTSYLTARRQCQREAAELFDKTILPYYRDTVSHTGDKIKPLDEWQQDNLWKWLEECAEEEHKRS